MSSNARLQALYAEALTQQAQRSVRVDRTATLLVRLPHLVKLGSLLGTAGSLLALLLSI